jgi:hypothetical protein
MNKGQKGIGGKSTVSPSLQLVLRKKENAGYEQRQQQGDLLTLAIGFLSVSDII